MNDIILAFITSFMVTYLTIPSIINIAFEKHLVDKPGTRRSHKASVPTLGGMGIFAGVLFSVIFWTPFTTFGNLQYILCAFVVIFLIGAKDDIIAMSPWKKLAGQTIAASILVFKSHVIINNMFGVFNIHALPEWFAILLSIFIILAIINGFNLIDGIDGLAGSTGVVLNLFLGLWFYLIGHMELAIVAFSTAGALIAFLKFNVSPAKIFMGDSGSYFVGLISAVLIFKFIELNQEIPTTSNYHFTTVPAIAFGLLVLPLFDTARVFFTRLLRGKSPLDPDRSHIHHMLIDTGMSHMKATTILIIFNISIVVLILSLQKLGSNNLLILILFVAITGATIISRQLRKQKAKSTLVS